VAQASRPAASTSRSTFLAFFLFLPLLSAADLTGTWVGLIEDEDPRRSRDLAFQFEQQGSSLSGKQYGDDISSLFDGGQVGEDGMVRFDVVIREQQGNQVNDVLYEYEGRIDGDGIQVTREKARATDAVSGAPVPVRRPNDTDEEDRARRIHTFRLERLF
jgi:hypothetical protein